MQQYRAIQFTRCRLVWLAGLVLSVLASIADAAESAVTPQHPLYLKHCAMCHEGGIPRAPHSVTFALSGPASVYRAMTTGPMVAQAASLTDTEKRELAEFLGASKLADAVTLEANCPADQTNIADGDSTTRNWGMSPGNWRFAEGNGAIRRDNVTRLKLKWAFGIPGVSQARSQPTYANGTLFTGTQTGSVYALDLETGCVRWRYDAGAEVRNAPVLAGFDGAGPQRVYFGDLDGRVHALDGQTGKRLWVTVVDPHPSAVITGTPQLFEDRLIVPISASEWASAADPAYGCCTFQGGVAALSTATGDLLWQSKVFDQPATPNGKQNDLGVDLNSPAGAPVWGSPSIDVKRRRVYIGTGEDYTSPATDRSDAVFALDIDSGERIWHYQSVSGDAWNMACFVGGGPNCPAENGPDLDIGAATMLITTGDRDLVIVGQKSGHVFALNPDTGKPVWRKRYGRGGFVGGVHWGMAFDGHQLLVPMADTVFLPDESPGNPGLYSIDPVDGSVNWFSWSESFCGPAPRAGCDRALSAPVTTTEDLVFAGGFDGSLRAYASDDGSLLWHFDTTQSFEGVNGTQATGGSIEAAGPVLANGHVIINSGYSFGGRMPGNALLVFSLDGQ